VLDARHNLPSLAPMMTQQNHTKSQPDAAQIEASLLALASERGPGATFCPSEAARALVGSNPDEWGKLMIPVRRVAVALALEGRLSITRKGKVVDPADFKGVYRLGLRRED
jgi:hypothetical protein